MSRCACVGRTTHGRWQQNASTCGPGVRTRSCHRRVGTSCTARDQPLPPYPRLSRPGRRSRSVSSETTMTPPDAADARPPTPTRRRWTAVGRAVLRRGVAGVVVAVLVVAGLVGLGVWYLADRMADDVVSSGDFRL